MEGKILTAYASTHGSTQEVAEAVAQALRGQGCAVDLLPAPNVRTVAGYSAVVLGTPLYLFHWHRDAVRFLTRHQKAITGGLPVAIFAGGPYGALNDAVWRDVRKGLDNDLAKFPWFTPVSTCLVGGRFDPAHLRFPWNLIPAMRRMPPSDVRDWEAIRAWAASLPALLASGSRETLPVLSEEVR